ncbi:MAG: hypothetical protein ACI4E1_08360 [Lachnospira sp.]
MNNFSVKNINFVGAGAAFLAFVFAFLPFRKIETVASFLGITTASYQESKSLAGYNFFGILFLIIALAVVVLCVLNLNEIMTIASMAASILLFVVYMLAIIIGNEDFKNVTSNPLLSAYVKVSFSIGFFLEFVMVVLVLASYWINEIVIKKLIFNASSIELNPLNLFNKAFSSSPNKSVQPQASQFNAQSQAPQFNAQPQAPQFNSQSQAPQFNSQSQALGQFNNNNQ